MRYRKLGRWGMRVSTVGLGSWLTYGATVDDDTARSCLLRAYERGVTLFDTADAYAGGRAEEVMGRVLGQLPRSSYVLATKVFFPTGRGPNDRGLSRKHVVEAAHASLRRLGTDHIDLYQCHRYDEATPVEETCRVMDDLVRQGKVLYWGTSEWSADQLAHATGVCQAEGWAPPAANQPQYSALFRRVEDRLLPMCLDLGVGNVCWSPLAMGVLTGKYASPRDVPEGTRAASRESGFMARFLAPETLDAVQSLRPLAAEAGCTLAQLALAWCLRQPAVSSVIVGATRVEQVDDNVAAGDLEVDPDLLERMGDLLDPVAAS